MSFSRVTTDTHDRSKSSSQRDSHDQMSKDETSDSDGANTRVPPSSSLQSISGDLKCFVARPSPRRSLWKRFQEAIICTGTEDVESLSGLSPPKFVLPSIRRRQIGPSQRTSRVPSKGISGYNSELEKLRDVEYPDLKGKRCLDACTQLRSNATRTGRSYLDNAGTQLPAKSLLDAFANDLSGHIYGNPHTNSYPARSSALRVEAVRKRVLEFFHANPDDYDLAFVANATAAIKLVGEAMRDNVQRYNMERPARSRPRRLWYGYHKDAHNSLIGLRALTDDYSRCFACDSEVDAWIEANRINPGIRDGDGDDDLGLFAYPGQSNMDGRRLPLRWLKEVKTTIPNTYTLLDAAALATTKQLNLDALQPDFTAVSFYKIFGFPDVGALIFKKSAGHVLANKRYFAGGTVDGVMAMGEDLMVRRKCLHEQLEEGTLPFHSIIALDHALTTHSKLFGSMDRISQHVCGLTAYCAALLKSLVYHTGQPLCEIYAKHSTPGDTETHGGTIAFNLYRSDGSKIGFRAVERAANAVNVYVRSGTNCNPGGMASHCGWSVQGLKQCFADGLRCTNVIELMENKWTGVIRISFGANSIKADADNLIKFLKTTYLNGSDGRPTGVSKA